MVPVPPAPAVRARCADGGAAQGYSVSSILQVKKSSPHMAPILYRIVNGTSSTCLNLTRKTRNAEPKTRLFRKQGFYNTIIYKYPNFSGDWPGTAQAQAKTTSSDGKRVAVADRPIETGIFIPMDAGDPLGGGYAIYLRQSGYKDMLREYLGVDYARHDMELVQDMRALDILDEIPSIDPFLVKARFDSLGVPLPEGAVDITPEEEQAMRAIIEARIGPILAKAFEAEGGGALSDKARARVLEAIWNPSLPESNRFVRAFGIHEGECAKVFFALQGITFYEYLFKKQWPHCLKTAEWLKQAAQPFDARHQPRLELDRMNMLRVEVGRSFAHTVKTVQGIFREYETALDAFVNGNSAGALRTFLFSAHRHFWALGHGIMAAANCGAVIDEAVRAVPGTPTFKVCSLSLSRLRIALAHRGESHRI